MVLTIPSKPGWYEKDCSEDLRSVIIYLQGTISGAGGSFNDLHKRNDCISDAGRGNIYGVARIQAYGAQRRSTALLYFRLQHEADLAHPARCRRPSPLADRTRRCGFTSLPFDERGNLRAAILRLESASVPAKPE